MKLFPTLKKMIEVKRNEKLNRTDFERKRQTKFTKLVRYINKQCPFYAQIIRDNNIDIDTCRPEDFPVITKSDVMDNFDRIVTCSDIDKAGISEFLSTSQDYAQLYRNKYHVLHTSGSSGEIGYFVFSEEDWTRGCTQLFRAHDVSLRKLKFAFFGVTTGHFAGISMAAAGEILAGRRNYDFKPYDVHTPLDSVIDGLNAYQPDYLIGYTSGLKLLAEQQIKGKLKLTLINVDSAAEPLTLADRQLLESAFQAPVLNFYASTEFLVMGVGKSDYQGLILFEDDLIYELHEDHSCITSLFNYTMPLIRYRMDDVLTPTSGPSPIPPYRQIEEVIGRMEQAPIFLNQHGMESFIAPSVIIGFYVKHLRQFQFQVVNKVSFHFVINFDKNITATEKNEALQQIQDKLKRILHERDLDNVTFTIEEVDYIPLDRKTGKFKLIVMER